MEQQETEGIRQEEHRGCVRIRLHEFTTRDGNTAYGVEISAWNAWAGQGKLLFFAGGLAYDDAFAMFTEFANHVRTYDWMEDDFVLENVD